MGGFSRSFEHEWLRIYESSGTDIAVIQKTFLNTSVDESAGATLKKLPDVAQAMPLILKRMDLTPEINAITYGWKADSFGFRPINLNRVSGFMTASRRSSSGICWPGQTVLKKIEYGARNCAL